ncbi:hypothetical protein [Pediococcus pentosaceus]|uniref:hypothetical protein n=1 Tax=Pediococcus pentosaceus TaxID=1255 RepID=UPI00223B54FD|nr:hypothetical protein [Pediococcus pentosaceus]
MKIEYVEMSPDEFDSKISKYQKELEVLFGEGDKLEQVIKSNLENIIFTQRG